MLFQQISLADLQLTAFQSIPERLLGAQLAGCVPDVGAVIDILMDVDLSPAGSVAGEDVVLSGGLYPRLSHGGGPHMNGGGPGLGQDPFSPPHGDGPQRNLLPGGSYDGGR